MTANRGPLGRAPGRRRGRFGETPMGGQAPVRGFEPMLDEELEADELEGGELSETELDLTTEPREA